MSQDFLTTCLHRGSQRASELENSGSADVSYTFGFGTGLLAAAAVSCCPTPEQLLPVALEAVLISFRIGLLAAHTRDQIIDPKLKVTPWRFSIVATNTKLVLQQLEEFSTQKVTLFRLCPIYD